MVDMVTNDMAWQGNYTTVDYSVYDVFDNSSLYHPYCPITDYQNATNAVECWSGDEHISLPDLATETSVVVDMWQTWVSNITATYGIDGIRLDACLEQNKAFFTSFESAAGVYIVCEVYDYPIDTVCDYQKYVSGLLNFPVWYLVIDAFGATSGSITNLYYGITEMQGNCTDVSLLGNFVENHDVTRFPYSVADIGLDQNAIAFVMLNDGIPIIYAGEEQYYSGGSPPADRETTWTSDYNTTTIYYQLIKKINALRTCLISKDATYVTAKSVPFFLDTQVLAVKKGSTPTMQTVGVYNNRGTGAEAYTINLANTGWTAGDIVYEIYTEQNVTVAVDNTLPVYMYGGQPRMYYLQSLQCPCVDTTNVCLPSAPATTAKTTSTSIILPIATTSSTSTVLPTSTTTSSSVRIPSSVPGSSSSSAVLSSSTPIVLPTSILATSSTRISSSVPGSSSSSSAVAPSSTPIVLPTSIAVVPSSTPIVLPTSIIATSSTAISSSVPGSSSSSSAVVPSSTLIILPVSIIATSSTGISSSVPGSSSSSPAVVPSSTPIVLPTSIIATSSTGISSSELGSSSSSAILPTSTTASSSAEISSSVPGSSSSSPVLPSSTTSSAEASVLPFSSSQQPSSGTSASIPASPSLSATIASSAAPAPATTAPICPSADGSSFIFNGQEFVVGCGIASDQEYFAQLPGTDIADCVHTCTTSTGTPACVAVTYSDGFCYLKTDPGAVHNENGSDSAFVISTPNGPETIVSGYLSGNISLAAPACPDANGNTFESNGYVYVVGCSIDNSVADISTAPGTDLAACVESCIYFSGTTSCAAVTYNTGNCHFKASVGTVFHAAGVDSGFIIANNANVSPVASPSGPTSLGQPWSGNPSVPSNPTGTYTMVSGSEVVVYMPLTESCP